MVGITTGTVMQITPMLRRVTAPNGGKMTGPGTNTYLVGRNQVAVIDPGPDIESHRNIILAAAGKKIRWILVTHTHKDHSSGAHLLATTTGAQLIGMPPSHNKHQDLTFIPNRVMTHGQLLKTKEFTIEALFTPGHINNHLCYLLQEEKFLMSGDHIMNGATVVIIPPHGTMIEYLSSLALLKNYDLKFIGPGHGDIITQPYQAVDKIINHRLKREQLILNTLKTQGPLTAANLTNIVYRGLSKELVNMANKSLTAHLIKLEIEQQIISNNDLWQLI